MDRIHAKHEVVLPVMFLCMQLVEHVYRLLLILKEILSFYKFHMMKTHTKLTQQKIIVFLNRCVLSLKGIKNEDNFKRFFWNLGAVQNTINHNFAFYIINRFTIDIA